MTIILRIIEVVLGLLALATISVFVFLFKPDWSPFQEQTFGSNVIPVATMVAAMTTLLVAYAAFRTIRSNREKEERDRKERLLNEIIEWAIKVNNFALRHRTEAVEEQLENSFRPFLDSQMSYLFDQFEPFRSESVYMAEIAPALGKELKSDVDSLIEALKSQIKDLHDYRRKRNTLAQDKEAQELARNIAQNNNEIHNSAVKLIKRIAKSNVADL